MAINWEVRKRRLAEYHAKVKQIETAWFAAQNEWAKKGLQPGAFTAFAAGYEAGMDRALEMAKEIFNKEAA
jgi:hypothetical protein